MTDQVMAALNDLSKREFFTDSDELVFCNEVGGVLTGDKMLYEFRRALELGKCLKSRIPGKEIRFHYLRHSFCTMAVQIFPLADVQGYAGHQDIATTMRYVHHVPKHDAADKLSALIDSESAVDLVPRDVLHVPDINVQEGV